MLGKQWLNRYASTGMRGGVIECGRDRQRKLNGIIAWYFEYVMESLPLMLQAALLLLGCALCKYLWEIDTTIGSVAICATLLGVTFYVFIVIAGTASEGCPYQTPGSRLLRSAASRITLVFREAIGRSKTVSVFREIVAHYSSPQPRNEARFTLAGPLDQLPKALILDASRLWRATAWSLLIFARRVYARLPGAPSITVHGLDQQTTLLDIQCISWVLRISLDKAVHVSTLESLATMIPLASFDPTLVADCFNVFIGCMKVINRTVVITPGLEKLATASATSLLRTFAHLSVVDPRSGVLGAVRQDYNKVFPSEMCFKDCKSDHTLGAIHRLLSPGNRHVQQARVEWQEYKPSSQEHVIFANTLFKLARYEYQRREGEEKVPRWILRFALHSLSSDPLPSTSVIVDCLSIIAVDLGCDITNSGTTILDERYIHGLQMSKYLTQNQ